RICRGVGVQCKREQQFGPGKVDAAVGEAELGVDASVIALARTATAARPFAIYKHNVTQLWDQADLSRQVRKLTPLDSAIQLVRTYFHPGHVEAFLGVPSAGPWM